MARVNLKNKIIELTGYDEKKCEALILAGKILVNEAVITKPGFPVPIDAHIRIKDQDKYVSRGAYKLLKGIEVFSPDIKGKICIDAGSSTGGFTEVLLLNNAQKVYAVDCGTNQLDYKLRVHPDVVSLEGRRVQDIDVDEFIPLPEFAVADLSFTSSIPVIDFLFNKLNVSAGLILIKPQFEFQRLKAVLGLSDNFEGVVRSETDREKIKKHIYSEIIEKGLIVQGEVESPIKGALGNVEYVFYIRKAEIAI